MKKLFLSLTLVAFASALQAGEAKDAKSKNPSKDATTVKAECSADKMKEGASCSACCKAEPKKQVLLSPKAAAEKRT